MFSNPKATLDSYALFPKKSLGQHFMHDPQALDKIVNSARIGSDDAVVEVGAGVGSLTAKLAERAREVFAIEIDMRLQPILEDRFDDAANVYLVFNDVLKTDVRALVGGQAYSVVANAPYYISSAILWHFLEAERPPRSMTMTMQAEVAERVTAATGQMNLLSVALQYYGTARVVGKFSPAVFWPRPNIHSAIVHIETHAIAPVDAPSRRAFFRVVKAGFSLKRKQLKNSLAKGLHIKAGAASELLRAADIHPQRRAETLNLREWACLARVIAERDDRL